MKVDPEPQSDQAKQLEKVKREPASEEVEQGITGFVKAIDGQKPATAGKALPAPAPGKAAPAPPVKKYVGDPLKQRVNIDFREMELTNVVALLAQKGNINVIASTDVSGQVTASIKDIPLMQAMEVVLSMNGLGMLEEEGIYRIVPAAEAAAARRDTRILYLDNAKADEVKITLDAIILGYPDAAEISVAANATTNVIIVSGPERRVAELAEITSQLDVAEPVIPTVTKAIKLNHAEPDEVKKVVEGMLTKDIGMAEVDTRGRHIVVTDIPGVVQQVATLVEELDQPVKQVAIEAMIVDAIMRDEAQTGTQWIMDLFRERDADGNVTGNLPGRHEHARRYYRQSPGSQHVHGAWDGRRGLA